MRIPVKKTVLLTILMLSGLSGLQQLVYLGPVSLQGLLTISYALVSWLLWAMRPSLTRAAFRALWPFLIFMMWTSISLLWYRPTINGLQNILVISSFTGLVLLAASISFDDYKFQLRVGKTLALATHIAAAMYASTTLFWGLGADIVSPRAFGAAALLGIAWHLSNWRYGFRRDLWWALAIVLVIVVSLSRMATAVALLLFPISQWSLANVWRLVRVSLLVALAVGAVSLALTYVDPVQERTFEGDTKLQVSGTSINVSGRDDYWGDTWNSYKESPWIGHGGGSSQELIANLTRGQITHPHNDYLRILHDYGAIGLAIWLFGFIGLLWRTWRTWVMADYRKDPGAPLYLTAFLSLVVVALVMITDNVMIYVNVMAPLGILVGAALGRSPG